MLLIPDQIKKLDLSQNASLGPMKITRISKARKLIYIILISYI